ncbi:MAG: TonB family protein [Opitutales bacterium]
MKRTILYALLISLTSVGFAQHRAYEDPKKQPAQPAPAVKAPAPAVKAPAPAVKAPAPAVKAPAKPVVVAQPKPVVKVPAKPVVVAQPKPVPAPSKAPVRFEVKKKKPTVGILGAIFGVRKAPPPSRAVVIVTSTPTTPVFEMSDLDREPQLIESPSIEYPESMLNAGRSGEVVMDVQIDQNGYVGLERVVSSTNADFEKEAVASLSTFKYEQPLKNGYPVNVRFALTIPFQISE